jgi:hypothetical protein
LSPLFFWRFAIAKKLGGAQHHSMGDGVARKLSRQDLIRKLTRRSHDVVSMDGFKASTLESAYRARRRAGYSSFVIIGHPKAMTAYSLRRLEEFLDLRHRDEFAGYAAFCSLLR